MRLFHCTPEYLNTTLLLNQHRTCHLLIESIAAGRAPRGGMSRYQNHAGFLAWMHWLAVQEMMMRGKNHESPVGAAFLKVAPVRRHLDIYIPKSRVALDIADLRRKSVEFEADGKMYDSRLPLRTAGDQLVTALALAKAQGMRASWVAQ